MCSCPGWINNRKCKHLKMVAEYQWANGRLHHEEIRPVPGSDKDRKEADMKESLGTEKFVERKIANVLKGMKN